MLTLIKALTVLTLFGASKLIGAEPVVRVDRPHDWYEPEASHHYKHAILGAPFGLIGYASAAHYTDSTTLRLIAGTSAAALVGTAYEVQRGWDGSAYMDPVDIGWTALGGLLGAGLGHGVDVALSRDEVAVGWVARF